MIQMAHSANMAHMDAPISDSVGDKPDSDGDDCNFDGSVVNDVDNGSSSTSPPVSVGGAATSPRQRRRAIVAMFLGSILEFYDFTVYSALNLPISKAFFPADDSTVTEFGYWAIFTIGVVARPVGAIIFGAVGDSKGRRQALLWTIAVMIIPTVLIGCIPTYDQISWAAPIILALLRLAQGLAIGGELGSTTIFTLELAPDAHRGLFGAIISCAYNIGIMLGTIVVLVVEATTTESQLNVWGWRVPFLAVIFTGSLAFLLRKGIPESVEFEMSIKVLAAQESVANAAMAIDQETGTDPTPESTTKKSKFCSMFFKSTRGSESCPGDVVPPSRIPFRRLLNGHFRGLLLQIGVSTFTAIFGNILTTWLPAYLRRHGIAPLNSQIIVTSLHAPQIAAILLAGHLVDLGMPVMSTLMFLGPLGTGLTFAALAVVGETPDILTTCLVLVPCIFLLGFLIGSMPAALGSIYPPHVRITGYALGYSIAFGAIAGWTPIVTTGLREGLPSDVVIYAPGIWLLLSFAALMPSAALLRRWYPHVNKPSRRSAPKWP